MTTTTTQTPGQRFAAQYGAHAVEQMLSTIKWVSRLAALITAIAMVTNYGHQRGYLLHIGTEVLGATLIPVSVDLLTVLCIKVISTPGMVRTARRVALVALAFPVTASAAISGSAPGSTPAKAVYVVAVVMIAVAELIKSTIRPDFTALIAAEAAIAPAPAREVKRCPIDCTCKRHARNRTEQHPVEAIEQLRVPAPVSPAPAGAARRAPVRRSSRPRLGKVGPGWMTDDVRLAVANAA